MNMKQQNNKTYIVYKHTSPSNKVYIGITSKDVRQRWCNGFGYQTQLYFFRAIVKYGWINEEIFTLLKIRLKLFFYEKITNCIS